MKIGTVTLGRAALLPVQTRASRAQSVFIAGDGTVRVRNKAPEERLVRYVLRNVVRTELEALDLFLTGESGANYKANAFDIIDDWSQTETVRWWDPRLEFTERIGRLYDVTVTFRIEA